MRHNPLRRCAPSPFSRIAARCGKRDDAGAAERPLRGVYRPGARRFHAMRVERNAMES